MRTSRLHPVTQRRFVWLLWLALLLPMAQAAATRHALSHTSVDRTGTVDGKRALHQGHCDLCLSAAAVGCGALPGAPQTLELLSARHELPQAVSSGAALVSATLAYRSRAPPNASV
ncbi:MAG: hypothetical protein ABI589_14565 [Burkholderiales bacterium]